MNKSEIIEKVVQQSGVGEKDCYKVLDTLEYILQQELAQSRGWQCVLTKIYQFLSYLKKE